MHPFFVVLLVLSPTVRTVALAFARWQHAHTSSQLCCCRNKAQAVVVGGGGVALPRTVGTITVLFGRIFSLDADM